MPRYQSDTQQLQEVTQTNALPILLKTREQFLCALGLPLSRLEDYFYIWGKITVPANVFLKHLMILADFSGKSLKKINDHFRFFFPDEQIEYEWQDQICSYRFQTLPVSGLNNDKLSISNKKLLQKQPLNGLFQDAIVLLLFGGFCTTTYTAEKLAQCKVGRYLGEPSALEKFAQQRYIEFSRITAGIKSGNLVKRQYILAEEVPSYSEEKDHKKRIISSRSQS